MPLTSPRRAVLRTAWSLPTVAVVSAAPAFAASPTPVTDFRVNVAFRTHDGYAAYTVTNLTTGTAPLLVRMTLPLSPPEATFQGGDYTPDWTFAHFDGYSYFLTAAVPPSTTSGPVTAIWTRQTERGNYPIVTTAGSQTITTTLPWAITAAASRRAPAPTTPSPRTRFGASN